MAMLSNPAFGPRVALIYVTIGSLLDVWVGVYWFSYVRGVQETDTSNHHYFWIAGLFLTGLTLIFLGLILGPLGQQARKAELPPAEAAPAEAAIQQIAAATPHPMMNPAMAPGMAPVMQGYPAGTPGMPAMQPAGYPQNMVPPVPGSMPPHPTA